MKPLSEHLKVLTDWLASGAFKVLIHREYATDNIVEAHESMMKDSIIGKLVVKIDWYCFEYSYIESNAIVSPEMSRLYDYSYSWAY